MIWSSGGAQVKELMPRYFVEVSILKCYMFLEPEKCDPHPPTVLC